jgi:hypothetical protein
MGSTLGVAPTLAGRRSAPLAFSEHLNVSDYQSAQATSGVGAQAWGLAAKLRGVGEAMSTERQTVVFEDCASGR